MRVISCRFSEYMNPQIYHKNNQLKMINIFISPWRKRSCLLIYIYTVYRQWPVANCWSVGTDFKRFRSPNIILVSRGLNMLPCGALVAANESCAASEELFVGLKPYTSCFYVTRCLPVGVLVPLTYEVRCLYCIYSLHVTTTSSHPVHPPSYLSKRVLPTTHCAGDDFLFMELVYQMPSTIMCTYQR